MPELRPEEDSDSVGPLAEEALGEADPERSEIRELLREYIEEEGLPPQAELMERYIDSAGFTEGIDLPVEEDVDDPEDPFFEGPLEEWRTSPQFLEPVNDRRPRLD